MRTCGHPSATLVHNTAEEVALSGPARRHPLVVVLHDSKVIASHTISAGFVAEAEKNGADDAAMDPDWGTGARLWCSDITDVTKRWEKQRACGLDYEV